MKEFDDRIPIYEQIMDSIKLDIATGKIQKGERLPSIRELALKLKVNPNTVQRAYQELEREAVTNTQRGMGSYVTGTDGKINAIKENMAREAVERYTEGMRDLGYKKNEIMTILKRYLDEEDVFNNGHNT